VVSDVVVTAISDRWHHDREADLLGSITLLMDKSPPQSIEETIDQILSACIGFVDAPYNAGLEVNVFDIFEQSIATVVSIRASRIANNMTPVPSC